MVVVVFGEVRPGVEVVTRFDRASRVLDVSEGRVSETALKVVEGSEDVL